MTLIEVMMSWKNTNSHYGSLSITLHWIMFLLVAAVYASIELRELFPKGSDPREALKALHFMLGLSVLLLVTLRTYVKVTSATPIITPGLSPVQDLAAKLGHLALYLLMIAMPILGWLMLSAAAKPIPFFGLQLPALIDENKHLAKSLKEIHETFSVIGYYLIGIHVLAALYHHYIRKDNTLTRILPLKKK
jgi:cytochrome b561